MRDRWLKTSRYGGGMRGKRVILVVSLILLFTSAIMGCTGLRVLWLLLFGGLLLALMGVFALKRLGFMHGKGVKRVKERRVKRRGRVKCQKCGFENLPRARYCANCGTKLMDY